MSEEPPNAIPTAPPRSTTTREHLIRFGLLGVGVALFFIGFQAGKEQQPAATPLCVQASAAMQSFGAQSAAQPTGSSSYWIDLEMMQNVVLQNQQCFGPADRAAAQTMADSARAHLGGQ